MKPFDGTLRVTNPAPESLANTGKRVQRPVRVTGGAKRGQRVPRPWDRAPKARLTVGAFVVSSAGAALEHCSTQARCFRSCRGPRPGRRHTRVLQEPESPRRFPVDNRWPGAAKPKHPRPLVRRRDEGSEDRRTAGYRQTKATKCGGTNAWESESFIVPAKPGNTPAWTRWREGGTE